MTTLVLGARALNNKIKLVSLPRVNWKAVYVLGISACLLLSVLYVFYVNKLTYGTYLIKSYNRDIATLSRENRSMEAQFAESGILDQIHDKVNQLGFEKASHIKYVEILDNSLAQAR